MKIIFCNLIYLLVASSRVFGQFAILDSSFSDDGIMTMFPEGAGYSVAIQDDGKIAIGCYDGTEGFGVARFNTDGSLDNTFGGDGFSKTTVGLGFNQDENITIQADGKIIAGGTCVCYDGYWCCGLARFNSDGTLDNSFNGGQVVYSFNDPQTHTNSAYGVAITPDQKIITIGRTSTLVNNNVFATARFNSNGTLDSSFGINGIVLTSVANVYSNPHAVAIQPDGKILVAGSSSSTGAPSSFAIVRYNTDGNLDNSFGTGGKDTIYFGAGGSIGDSYDIDVAYGMALQTNGKIVLTGVSYLGTDTFFTIPIAKYHTNGTLDESFGIGGKTRVSFPNYKYPYGFSIAIQQDNKAVITGKCSNNSSDGIIFLLRILENGSLDSTFGANGISYTAVDSNKGDLNWAKSVAMDATQKIIVTGHSYPGMTVLRYLSGLTVGIVDLSIPNNSVFIYPNPIYSHATLRYILKYEDCISISLLDMQGKAVQIFFNNESRSQGEHTEELKFNQALPAGNFVLSIFNGRNSQNIKVALVK